MKTFILILLAGYLLIGCTSDNVELNHTGKSGARNMAGPAGSYRFSPEDFYSSGDPKPMIIHASVNDYAYLESSVSCNNYNSYPMTLQIGNNGYISDQAHTLDILAVLEGGVFTRIDAKTIQFTVPPYQSIDLKVRFGVPTGADECATTVTQVQPYGLPVMAREGDLLETLRMYP